jgi:predicted nucleic acid-binding protein
VSRVFIDTSAIFGLLVSTDTAHDRARRIFDGLRTREAPTVTTSYVLVETYALLSRRMGRESIQRFREDFAPLLEVCWIDERLHEAGLDLLQQRRWKGLSLVDAVSFVVIRERQLDAVFVFDRHFEREGFAVLE